VRRYNAVPAKGRRIFHDITMDLAAQPREAQRTRRASRPDRIRLPEFFMASTRAACCRARSVDAVWGPEMHVETRTVDVHSADAQVQNGDATRCRPSRARAGVLAGYRAGLSRVTIGCTEAVLADQHAGGGEAAVAFLLANRMTCAPAVSAARSPAQSEMVSQADPITLCRSLVS